MHVRDNIKKTRNRTAFTLIEMLILTAAIVVITSLAARANRQWLGNTSRMHRDFQTNTTLQDMLRTLRKDIESSSQIESEPRGLLHFGSAGEGISYEFYPAHVLRVVDRKTPDESVTDVWSVPHSHIKWKIYDQDDKGYALEVSTSIERVILDRREWKLQNSHIFFTGLDIGDEN